MVAAAVVLDGEPDLAGLRDSKLLAPARREAVAARIHQAAVAVAWGWPRFRRSTGSPSGAPCRSAAASIVAKVYRDRQMLDLDARFPHYGFARHKGYATSEHLDALDRHGPSPVHRRSFLPVRAASLLASE